MLSLDFFYFYIFVGTSELYLTVRRQESGEREGGWYSSRSELKPWLAAMRTGASVHGAPAQPVELYGATMFLILTVPHIHPEWHRVLCCDCERTTGRRKWCHRGWVPLLRNVDVPPWHIRGIHKVDVPHSEIWYFKLIELYTVYLYLFSGIEKEKKYFTVSYIKMCQI